MLERFTQNVPASGQDIRASREVLLQQIHDLAEHAGMSLTRDNWLHVAFRLSNIAESILGFVCCDHFWDVNPDNKPTSATLANQSSGEEQGERPPSSQPKEPSAP